MVNVEDTDCPECGHSWVAHGGNGCITADCECKVEMNGPGVCPTCGTTPVRLMSEEDQPDGSVLRRHRCPCGTEWESEERIVEGSYIPGPKSQN